MAGDTGKESTGISVSQPSVVTVNIFGSCVCREPFNYMPVRYNLELKEYVFKVGQLFADPAGEDWPLLSESEVHLEHDFVKRSMCTLLNGTARERLLGNKGDWIILDDHYLSYDLFEISCRVGGRTERRIVQAPAGKTAIGEMDRIISAPRYEGYSIRRLDALPNYSLLIPRLASFLKDNWGSNIIFVDAGFAQRTVGDVFGTDAPRIDYSYLYYSKLAARMLLDCLECHYVPMQSELFSRDGHPLHYGYEVYEYLATVFGEIIRRGEGWESRCQKALADLQVKQSRILYEGAKSMDQVLSKADDVISRKRYGSFGKVLALMKDNVDLSTTGRMEERIAFIYSHDKFSGRDLDAAAEWIHRALAKGGNFHPSLYGILSKRGTPDDLEELRSIASSCAGRGDGVSMGWLGRLYRDGRGVPKDMGVSAEWFSKASRTRAARSDAKWIRWEYVDVLWNLEDPESDKRMFGFALPLAEKGLKEFSGRVARMYRDGRGTDRDLVKAAEWMRKAKDQGVKWAYNELFDILWEIDTPEADAEMVAVASEHAATGNGGAMGRLGRAYRDGRGVERDLAKAAEWMGKAAGKGVGWAKAELRIIERDMQSSSVD